jgi:hypothetical protein
MVVFVALFVMAVVNAQISMGSPSPTPTRTPISQTRTSSPTQSFSSTKSASPTVTPTQTPSQSPAPSSSAVYYLFDQQDTYKESLEQDLACSVKEAITTDGYRQGYFNCLYDNINYAVTKQPCPASTNRTTEVGCIISHYSYRVSDDVRPIQTEIQSSYEEPLSLDVSDLKSQTALCRLKNPSTSVTVFATVPTDKVVSRVSAYVYSSTSQLVTSISVSKINADGSVANTINFTPTYDAKLNQFLIANIPLTAAGNSANLRKLKITFTLRAANVDFCLNDIILYEAFDPVDELGFFCNCANDFSYGSACGRHTPDVEPRSWCYVNPECGAGIVSERTDLKYKYCTEVGQESTCQTATFVNEARDFYFANTALLSDKSALIDNCGFGLKGVEGLWVKVLGSGKQITINTCKAGYNSFSTTAAVFRAEGETPCDTLSCLDGVEYNRVQCGEHAASKVTFLAQDKVFYFLWIGPDSAPYSFVVNQDLALGSGVFAFSINGNTVYNLTANPPSEQEQLLVSLKADEFAPSTYEIQGSKCLKGYELVQILHPDCGSLDPNCERFTYECHDIDECLTGLSNCHPRAHCINTVGSFQCLCGVPYVGDGINECAEKPSWELLDQKRQIDLTNDINKLNTNLENGYGIFQAKVAIQEMKNELLYLNTAKEQDFATWKAKAEAAQYRKVALDTAGSKTSVPNIGYLGRGYDYFLGNPASETGVDPGYRLPLLEFAYGNKLTEDGLYSLPDGVEVIFQPFSSFESSTKVISSESEYQSSVSEGFSLDISAGFSYSPPAGTSFSAEGAFSLNTEHESTLQSISNSDSIFIQIIGRATTYEARLDTPFPEKVAPAFAEYVKNLDPSCEYDPGTFNSRCNSVEEQKYQEVIKLYGTHYTKRVQFGGKAFERYVLNKNEMQSLQTDIASSTTGGSLSGKAKSPSISAFFKTSFEVTSKLDTSARSYLQNTNVQRKQWYLGGVASDATSDDGSLDSIKQWAYTVASNPIPVAVDLQAITDLMTPVQFPDDPSIGKKQKHMLAVLYNACNRLGGDNCGQFLSRTSVSTSPEALKFGDFIEISAVGDFANVAPNEILVLAQETSFTSVGYPIVLKKASVDTTTGEVTINGTPVKTPKLTSSPDTKCYCDPDRATATVTVDYKYDSDGNYDVRFRPFIKNPVTQQEVPTEWMTGRVDDDYDVLRPRTASSVTINLVDGFKVTKMDVEMLVDDDTTLQEMKVNLEGLTYSFSKTLQSPVPYKITLDNPSESGTRVDYCKSFETKHKDANALTKDQCAQSCLNTAVTPISGFICSGFSFYEPGKCSLFDSDQFFPTYTSIASPGIEGSATIKCSTKVPAYVQNVPQFSSKVGIEEFPIANTIKFQVLSPYLLYNEARRNVLYGDSILLTSISGAVTAGNAVAPSLLMSRPVFQSVTPGKLTTVEGSENYSFISLRPLSNVKKVGTSILSSDPPLFFEITSGYYSILFNRLSAVLLGVAGKSDTSLKAATLLDVTSTPYTSFDLRKLDPTKIIPTSGDISNNILRPSIKLEIIEAFGSYVKFKATISPKSIVSTNGQPIVSFNQFVVELYTPGGSKIATGTIGQAIESTIEDRTNLVFLLTATFLPNDVLDKVLRLSLPDWVSSINGKPVIPEDIVITDPRPPVTAGTFIYVDNQKKLTGIIGFKQPIFADTGAALQYGSDYYFYDQLTLKALKTCTASTVATQDSIQVSCSEISKDSSDKIAFVLNYPCLKLLQYAPGDFRSLCTDSSNSTLSTNLIPDITVETVVSTKRTLNIQFKTSLANNPSPGVYNAPATSVAQLTLTSGATAPVIAQPCDLKCPAYGLGGVVFYNIVASDTAKLSFPTSRTLAFSSSAAGDFRPFDVTSSATEDAFWTAGVTVYSP